MKPRLGKAIVLWCLGLLLLLMQSSTPPIAAQVPGIQGPFFGPPIRAVSFDGDVRRLPQALPSGTGIEHPIGALPNRSFAPASLDPVRQTRQAPAFMPPPLQNFKGLDLFNWGSGWPPDTNGDVGPNHYIQTVNTSIGIFNKTGTQLAAYTYDTFFTGTGTPCDTANQGDPIVLYDPQVDRWIITDFAWANFSTGPYYECIAVSKTSDPVLGGWWLYGMLAHNTLLADYPKLGVWADGYYMSANLYIASSGANQGVRVWALDRSSMISGTLNEVHFDLSTSRFGLLPSNLRGSLPPSGSPEFFLSAGINTPDTVLNLWKFHVDWGNPASSTFTGPTVLTVASYSYPFFEIPQLGTSQTLDAIGLRLMMQLQYRNIGGTESLWANHTTVSGGVTGVRWYEIRNPNGSPTVYQQSTFQPDSNYRWIGSLAVDHNGNMAIGYSLSSSSMYPAIVYAGRLASDPLSALSQGETTLIAGTGAQTSIERWGDYSAMSIDPADDCTFWYTNEYYETTGTNWQTRIGSFKFPSCSSAPPVPSKVFLPLVAKDWVGIPSGWRPFVTTNFEGLFPGPWQMASTNTFSWGKRDCRPFSGSQSGWAVGGGLGGAALACGSSYPDDVNVWMIYGPFSLADATAAEMRYKLWLNSNVNDQVCQLASIDGNLYYGNCSSGDSSGWIDQALDLAAVPTLGNLLGQSNVWVAIAFMSDSSGSMPEGVYVDDIVVRECPTGETCAPGTAPSRLSDRVIVKPAVKQVPRR